MIQRTKGQTLSQVSTVVAKLVDIKDKNGAPIRDLLHFYTAIARPVLEYSCPVWHSGLTVRQSKAIENIQKHTICIIYGRETTTLHLLLRVDSLKNRHETLMARYFKRQVLDNNALLHHLLPK